MKPVSYQSMPSSVNGGHPDLSLDHLLRTSNVMRCEKCGFATADAVLFKKHVIEHMGTRFYCFYCNSVSFSEVELNEHLKQHTSKYPFKCPHCGQGYMRRRCLLKHIDRLHSKSIIQGPPKPGMTRSLLVPVPSALTSAPTADVSPLRPLVRVTLPSPVAPAVILGKDEQRGKTLDTNVPNATDRNEERVSPLSGLIQHNRALTVSLPEEVSIPAGCLVELVEVKTVNGTKELKLRLVSQQENEAVIKDTKTAVPQNTTTGKALLSTFRHPNTLKHMSMGTCTVNRKKCEAKTGNVEHPAVALVNNPNHPPNLVSKEKNVLKRASSEIINLECNSVIPNKMSKTMLNPVRDVNGGVRLAQMAAVNHNAAPSPVISGRVGNRLTTPLQPGGMGTSVQRALDERKNSTPENSKIIPPRMASDTSNIKDLSAAVKLEPGENRLKSSSSSTAANVVCLNQQSTPPSKSSTLPVAAVSQVRPSAISVNKDNVEHKGFPIPRTLNKPSPINHTDLKTSAWLQEVRSSTEKRRAMSEPESFPVISSVFSLSDQPEGGQGSIQPLVMALRGIVMEKKQGPGSPTQGNMKMMNGTEQMCEAQTSGHCTRVASKNTSITSDASPMEPKNQSMKVEDVDKAVQHTLVATHDNMTVKEEKNDIKTPDTNKCSHIPNPKLCEESKIASSVKESAASDAPQPTDRMEHDISSKFLTICLKRVQVGVWRKRKKGLKPRISRCKAQVPVGGLTDSSVIYPMPLREDQPVKRPGPNQPVVVLNHPKPRASVHVMTTDTFPDTGTSETVPKCQILKMRLGKVMGQKYEVMGCTVGVFP
ncbi:uncharacterized protein znf518b isoform 1-T2 [Menidia menidia]